MKRLDFTSGLTAGIFGALSAAVEAQPAQQTEIRLGTNASDDITPLLWAQTSGMYARAGIKINLQRFSSGSAAIAALIGGALDVTRVSVLPPIIARSRGIPLQMVAPAELSIAGNPTEGIVTLKESTITSGRDLKGAIMPIPALHDFDELASRAWIDATGGDSSTVKFIELPQSSVLAALEQGRVAAAFMSNPFLTNAVTSGRVKIVGEPVEAIAKRFLVTCYCSTESFIKSHLDVVRKFADVLARSVAYTNSHHAEVVGLLAPYWGVDAATIANMAIPVTASSLNPKDLEPLIDAALRYGVIRTPVAAKSLIAPGVG